MLCGINTWTINQAWGFKVKGSKDKKLYVVGH